MRRVLATTPVLVIAAVLVSCSGASSSDQSRGSAAPTAQTATTAAGANGQVTVRGTATLDGGPFDAKFIGAEVRDNGLDTPCQADIPKVASGRFELPVYADDDGFGCGRPGAEIILWTYIDDLRVFSTTTVPWPASGTTVTFDAPFSKANPQGASSPATELAGEVWGADNFLVDPGGKVEARIGNTVCGLSTVRQNQDFTGFSLKVVGPASIPGCTKDGTITLTVDGTPVKETLPNDGSLHRSFDLTLTR